MFGLDERIANASDGSTLVVVLVVAIVLGLRHASDPDHLVAVSSLVALDPAGARRGAFLGVVWGAGHATSLFLLGLPIVLYGAFLPDALQQAAETGIGLVIIALGLAVLWRWRGRGHAHVHVHGGVRHSHAHDRRDPEHGHAHPARSRSARGAFALGLAHGVGGSAGVGILLLATVANTSTAVTGLALFAAGTAVSMAALSAGFASALGGPAAAARARRAAPVLGVWSVAFGLWYTLAAQGLVPYLF